MFGASSSFGLMFDFALRPFYEALSSRGLGEAVPHRETRVTDHRGALLSRVDRDVDVAPCSVGICARLAVGGVHNGLRDFALQAWQPDVKPCLQEVNVARIAQVYFGIDRHVSWKLHFHPVSHNPHRTDETGRPAGGKQLLRIGASSWNSGSRKLNVQATIITASAAAAATAQSMGLGGVPYLYVFLGRTNWSVVFLTGNHPYFSPCAGRN